MLWPALFDRDSCGEPKLFWGKPTERKIMHEIVELICPNCSSGMQYYADCTFLQCPACANRFESQKNVLLLSEPTSSWNLISTDMMKEINSFANKDTWQKAINKLCPPRFLPVINEDGRADWKYLLNIDSG